MARKIILKCQVGKCRNESDLNYYNRRICKKHWEQHCKEEINLKDKLNIKTKDG